MRENLLPAVIGFVLFALFVGYLAIDLMDPPLLVVIGFSLLLCVVDFIRSVRAS